MFTALSATLPHAAASPVNYAFVRAATTIAPNDDGSGRHLNAPKFRMAGTGRSFASVGMYGPKGGSLALVSYVEDEQPARIVSAAANGQPVPLAADRATTKDCQASDLSRCVYTTVVSFELNSRVLGPGIVSGLSYRLTDTQGRVYDFIVPASYLRAVLDAWLTIDDGHGA